MTAATQKQLFILILCSLFVTLAVLPFITKAQDATTTDSTSSAPVTEPATVAPTPVPPSGGRLELSPVAQTRITNLAANMSNRLDAHARRLDNVLTRLGSRIEKVAAEGKNVDTAQAALTTARAELAKANTSLSDIDDGVSSFVGSDNPRASWQSLRATYTNIHTTLRSAHTAAGQCILLLQSARVPVVDTVATTTPAL